MALAPDGDRVVSTGFGVAGVWALDLDDLVVASVGGGDPNGPAAPRRTRQ